MMRFFLLMIPLAVLAACTEQAPPGFCREETKRCLNIETREIGDGGKTLFQVRLSNICREEVEYKLCFEVPRDAADCRQNVLERAQRAEETIAADRFGGRTRLYVRYVSEAKACRFPLTPDVRF